MANAASYARFSVSASDKWSRLSSNTSSAINAMHTHWRERYANAERACTRLGIGERHPDVEKALETLRNHTGDAKGTVTQLKKDYNAWLREVRQLREFAIKDRDEIRAAICTAGEYDVPRRVNEVADRWASQISSSYGTILGQADRLKSRAQADKLKKYKGPRAVIFARADERHVWSLLYGTGAGRSDAPADHPHNVNARVAGARRTLGAKYVRAPEWGTYLSAKHVEAIGRDKLVAAAAVAKDVGTLLYLQCSAHAADALGPEARERRIALAALLAPISVG